MRLYVKLKDVSRAGRRQGGGTDAVADGGSRGGGVDGGGLAVRERLEFEAACLPGAYKDGAQASSVLTREVCWMGAAQVPVVLLQWSSQLQIV